MSDQQQNPPIEPNIPGLAGAAETQAMIQNAFQSPTVPRLYANGVGLGMSGGDTIIVLFANSAPVGILNLPFIAVRGMIDDLTAMLKDVKDAIGSRIPGPRELAQGMARVQQAKATNAPPSGK